MGTGKGIGAPPWLQKRLRARGELEGQPRDGRETTEPPPDPTCPSSRRPRMAAPETRGPRGGDPRGR
eukprot:6894376-Pyramimonas_sp.AAC.1